MELPDFMSYANKFSQTDFVDKIARIAKRAGSKLVYAALILYYTLQSDKISKTNKAMIIGALGYMISPLDVVPDAIPIAGLTDDLAVLLFVLKKVWTEDARQCHDVRYVATDLYSLLHVWFSFLFFAIRSSSASSQDMKCNKCNSFI